MTFKIIVIEDKVDYSEPLIGQIQKEWGDNKEKELIYENDNLAFEIKKNYQDFETWFKTWFNDNTITDLQILCCIIDYDLGSGKSGFDILKLIKQRNSNIYCILNSGSNEITKNIDILKKFNRLGLNYWIIKGESTSVDELNSRIFYAYRKYYNIFASFYSDKYNTDDNLIGEFK